MLQIVLVYYVNICGFHSYMLAYRYQESRFINDILVEKQFNKLLINMYTIFSSQTYTIYMRIIVEVQEFPFIASARNTLLYLIRISHSFILWQIESEQKGILK